MNCSPAEGLIDGAAASGGTVTTRALDDVVAEFDFSNMGSFALGNGTNTLPDTEGTLIDFVGGSTASATTFDILQGTGIRFRASIANNIFTSGAQTAPHLYFPLSEIYDNYGIDSTYTIIIEVYFSLYVAPTANAGVTGASLSDWGITNVPSNGTSAGRLRGVSKLNPSGTLTLRSINNTTGGSSYNTGDGVNANVLAMTIGYGGMNLLGGIWGGTWETTPMQLEVGAPVITSNNPDSFKDRTNRITMSFATGNTAGDMQVDAQRMLIRAR